MTFFHNLKTTRHLIIGMIFINYSSGMSCSLLTVAGDSDLQASLENQVQYEKCQNDTVTPLLGSSCWSTIRPAYKLARLYGKAYSVVPRFNGKSWIIPVNNGESWNAVKIYITSRGKNLFVRFVDEITEIDLFLSVAESELDMAYSEAKVAGRSEIRECRLVKKILKDSIQNCKVFIPLDPAINGGYGITFTLAKSASTGETRGKSFKYEGMSDCGPMLFDISDMPDELDLSRHWRENYKETP